LFAPVTAKNVGVLFEIGLQCI